MVEFPQYLKVRQPDQFFIEQVKEIAKTEWLYETNDPRVASRIKV